MPFKIEIHCDGCGEAIDIDPTTIFSGDSVNSLCEIMNWEVIDFPHNCAEEPEKQYILCQDCDEDDFFAKTLHAKCAADGAHGGKIFYCSNCDKYFCEDHFDEDTDTCLACLDKGHKIETKEIEDRIKELESQKARALALVEKQHGKEVAQAVSAGVCFSLANNRINVLLSTSNAIEYLEFFEQGKVSIPFLQWTLKKTR